MFRKKIVKLQSDVGLFSVEFLDRDEFKKFADNIQLEVNGYTNICITGYFSETIRDSLENIIKYKTPSHKMRLICPYLDPKKTRDKKNLQALRKLANVGAEIKINDRLHARFFVAYNLFEEHPYKKNSGLLLIGSFDFNTECIGRERYDAGIKTKHPDLVKSAVELFEQIWNESESITLKDFMEKGKH